MMLLRDAQKSDLPGLKRLAAVLDTVNLPNDEAALARILDTSARSFAGKIREAFRREYLFVLEDPKGRILGTSMILAQHGTREAPHVFFEVSQRESYSASLDRHFRHQVLSLAYNYEGPTEIGGLVVDPAFRGLGKPGKQLSFVRFLFLAMHRERFRDVVLAELLPPLLADGRSLLWESIGRRFTGLDYHEADRLSRQNKEFIKELFPQSDLWATLLPPRAQQVIGRVGPETEGVRKILERIGFRYVERIDPFDGGPHFEAQTSAISLVRHHRKCRVLAEDFQGQAEEHLVGLDTSPGGRSRFRAVRTMARVDGETVALPLEARARLGVLPGRRVHLVPFE